MDIRWKIGRRSNLTFSTRDIFSLCTRIRMRQYLSTWKENKNEPALNAFAMDLARSDCWFGSHKWAFLLSRACFTTSINIDPMVFARMPRNGLCQVAAV